MTSGDRPAVITRLSSVATRSTHDATLAIDRGLVDRKAADARAASRRREIHVLHEGDADPLQRMLNALQPGTYVAPHRHLDPPKSEALVLLQGSLALVVFGDDAALDLERSVLLAPDNGVVAVDCRPGVWHTIIALAPDTVVFECKPGPYDATVDKDFASWAPREGDPRASRYLAEVEDRVRAHFGLGRRCW